MNRRAKVFAFGAALVALISAVLVNVSTGTSSAGPDCTKTLVIGAHGIDEGGAADFGGFGEKAVAVLGSFNRAYGQGAVDAVPLDFPLVKHQDLYAPGRISVLFASVNAGISILVNLLVERAIACPTQPIVLVGYSEGAWIVHQALFRIGSQISGRIVGIGLLADPVRIGTDSYNIGTASHDFNGIGVLYTGDPRPVPSALQGRTLSWCDDGDPVCAFDTRAKNPVPVLVHGFTTHTQYVSKGEAQQLGTRLGNLARGFLPAPGCETTSPVHGGC